MPARRQVGRRRWRASSRTLTRTPTTGAWEAGAACQTPRAATGTIRRVKGVPGGPLALGDRGLRGGVLAETAGLSRAPAVDAERTDDPHRRNRDDRALGVSHGRECS